MLVKSDRSIKGYNLRQKGNTKISDEKGSVHGLLTVFWKYLTD